MSRVLFFCNTPYQLIVATILRYTEFSHCEADLIVTDHISSVEQLYSNIVNSEAYNNVFLLKSKCSDWKNKYYALFPQYYDSLLYTQVNCPSIRFKILLKSYDFYLYANIAGAGVALGNLIIKNNSKIEISLFEDGFASYTDLYLKKIQEMKDPTNIKNKILLHLHKTSLFYVKKMFLFNPQIVNWDLKIDFCEIPPINSQENIIQKLNKMFSYDTLNDTYNAKYIFFEESYYADRVPINDIEIVNKIVNIVGKENLIIKIHPRNPENRFRKMGLTTNISTHIPWEIIALNLNTEDKILITISSGSFITSYFMSGIKSQKSILLYQMDDKFNKNQLTPSINIFNMICKPEMGVFDFPLNESELINLLKGEQRIEDNISNAN